MSKVAVVTGAGGVLCSSFAKELAKNGYAVALLDLNEEAVKKVAETYPELKVNYNLGGGSNPSDFSNSSMPNPYKKETLNLTKQMLLEQNNPSLAAKFKAEAGLK